MKKLTMFKLERCPYCKKALSWLAELMEEFPEYKGISIEYINEDEQPAVAKSYDYYNVPCFFSGDKKLHEGIASKEKIKEVLDYCR